jgi:signal transduction histidine kinase/BarA-like signal transduction histidine kinase
VRLLETKHHRNQLVFLLAGIAIAIMVVGAAGSPLTTIEKQLRDDVKQQVGVLTDQAASNAEDHILMVEQAIQAFSVQSTDIQQIQPALKNFMESFNLVEVAYVGKDGLCCRADGTPFTAEESSTAPVTSERNGITYHASYLSSKGEYVYQATKELTFNGEVIGTMYVGIPTDMMISKQEFSIYEGKGAFLLFEGDTGNIIMAPTGENSRLEEGSSLFAYLASEQENDVDANFLSSAHDEDSVDQIKRAVQEQSSVLVTTPINQATFYVCVAPVGLNDYYVCGLVPEESVRSEIASVNMIFGVVFGIIFLCLLAVLAMFLFFYRKRMEERGLELKTHLYGALSDSLDMAVNMYSPEDAIVTPIVAKSREIMGYSMAEFMGNRRVADRVDLSDSGRDMLGHLRDGNVTTLERGEFSLRHKQTGDLRWVSYSVTPLLFENKRQLLVVFRDSTDEKNLQLSMKEAMVAAETANHAKSDFLSRMSHEIRTPMNAITGLTQIAQKHGDDPERVQESLDKIMLASDHLLMLINDVLDISKIESGKMMLMNQAFEFSELIEQVETVINTQSSLKEQSFSVAKGELLEEHFLGDQVRLKQVLINLLSNAVKYTPAGGHIEFSIEQQWSIVRGYVQVTFIISDDGIGMSEEFLEHLFEPFVMEGRSRAQGTGLGMPIVKNILTMMNGDIHVESKIEKGTTFTVVLTLEQAAKGEKPSQLDSPKAQKAEIQVEEETKSTQIEIVDKKEEQKTRDLSGVRVLLAEDNELNAEIAKELLVDAGLEVDRACNGEEVCTMFADSDIGYYDIVLMDIQMPLKTGYEATACIRELDREDALSVPIVAMSANAFAEDIQASLRSGMNAHVSKPIDLRLLLETISEQTRKKE